jgi:hypothetical protein
VKRSLLAIGAMLLVGAIALAVRTEPIGESHGPAPIVFVCRNGVAMSLWSAAYFNRLAAARGLSERAIARASIPSFTAVPSRMIFALAVDGFRLGGYVPHAFDAEDARTAALVVAIDTELPADALANSARTEVWAGFPPMREQYFPSRAALRVRVEALVERFAAKRTADDNQSDQSGPL